MAYSLVCIGSSTLRSLYWIFCLFLFLYISLESITKGKFASICNQAVGLSVNVLLKSDSHLLNFFFFAVCVTESPLKMIKNYYFILKALFVHNIFKFLSWHLKARVNSNFHNVRIPPENEARRLVRDLFLVFEKALYKVNASGPLLRFNLIW